jgi:hypothetical protein
VQHASRHRVRRRQPGKRVYRQLAAARRQHQVAEPAAAQHRGVRDQAGLRENRPRGRDLGSGVRQRHAVGHVGGEDPALPQRAAGGRHELHRSQVGGRAPARENVRDHHVETGRWHLLEHRPGVAGANPDPSACPGAWQRQPEPQEFQQRGVQLDHHLR